jgi:hypothetical protein
MGVVRRFPAFGGNETAGEVAPRRSVARRTASRDLLLQREGKEMAVCL